jgi:hypothetical protein
VEIYHASTVPAEFVDTGMSKCMTVVIWSRQKIRP